MEILGMRKVSAVVFDMDGVLIDSEPLWRKAEIKVLGNYGILLTEDDCKRLMGLRTDEVVKQILKDFDADYSVEKITREVLDAVCVLIMEDGKTVDGMFDIVKTLSDKNIPLAVATSSPMQVVNTVLEKTGLKSYFNTVVSAEKFPYGKPHPEVYLQACRLLGFSPTECVAVEDSVNGVISARASRMQVIAMPDIESKENKAFGASDVVVSNVEELKTVLFRLVF